MQCHKCKAKMIKNYAGVLFTTYPPQQSYTWWCACGAWASGEVETIPTPTKEELLLDEWENENNKKLSKADREALLDKYKPTATWSGPITYNYCPKETIIYEDADFILSSIDFK